MKTLKQFSADVGGFAKAAKLTGVNKTTFWRWLGGKSKPKGNNAKELRRMGVRC